MSSVRDVSPAQFDTDVLAASGKVVVDFWAPWCGPCKAVAPEVDRLAEQFGDVTFVKLNIDDAPDVASKFNIMGIPTIGLFEGGQLKATSVGAKPAQAIAGDLGL